MKKAIIYLLASLPLLACYSIKAQEHSAHVHGLATLSLALEKNILDIQFESPAANLWGFEHEAKNSEQKRRVKQTNRILNSPDTLFLFKGTHCKLINATINLQGALDSDHKDHHHETTHSNHNEHDDHAGHSEAKHIEAEHSEITANYRFNCKDADAIKSVSTTLFTHFPGIEKINALWVGSTRQGAKVLNKTRNAFSLQ